MRLINPIGLKQALAVSAILEDKKTIEQIIDEQPTIEPEPHWIKCSERLPEETGWYLASGMRTVDYRWYSTLHGWESVGGFRVIAWMPLPEPYKEGES